MHNNSSNSKMKIARRNRSRATFGLVQAILLLQRFEMSCGGIFLALVPRINHPAHDDVHAGRARLCRDKRTAKIELGIGVTHTSGLQSAGRSEEHTSELQSQ